MPCSSLVTFEGAPQTATATIFIFWVQAVTLELVFPPSVFGPIGERVLLPMKVVNGRR